MKLRNAKCETGKFILGVVKDMWVRKIKYAKTYYTLVIAGQLFSHLQETYGELHALDVLTLQN